MEKIEYGDLESNNILIQMVDEHDLDLIENEVNLIKKLANKDFKLVVFKVNDWNKDLSPWKAPAVFGNVDFGDGANNTLKEVLAFCKDETKNYYIGGYSLAALFSIYASFNTNIFKGVAAASPSMWFPNFIDYMKNNKILTNNIYLSLGNKEHKARNQIMASVKDKIEEAYNYLKDNNKNVILEYNEGNHFKDSDIRTAKAFVWILNN